MPGREGRRRGGRRVDDAARLYGNCQEDVGYTVLASVAGDKETELKAAQMFFAAKDFAKAGQVFENLDDYEKAGAMYERADDAYMAGEMYVRAGNKLKAAEMFEKNGSWQQAAELYLNVESYDKAAAIAKKAHKEGLTLKEAAVGMGHVTEEEFANWVVPIEMTYPT